MSQSRYAARMAKLSARIFGEIARPEVKKSVKVVKLMSQPYFHEVPHHVYLYPRHHEINDLFRTLRHFGLFRSEHADFVEEMERLRNLRGKGRAARESRKKKKAKSAEA